MFFGAFAVVYGLFTFLFLFLGARLLGKFNWVLHWLRGTVGLVFFAIGGFIVFIALDLWSYKQLLIEKPIVMLSFEKLADKEYHVELNFVDEGITQSYIVSGDQWQLDARIIRWKGFFRSLGARPGYRLDRLSGRYFSLEDERRGKRTIHQLRVSEYGIDAWDWVNSMDGLFPWIESGYGSATYLPMADGAIYQVSLAMDGLTAKALNDNAESAIKRWR
ncbi:MAG: cation/multidrug efflux pump [Alteromonadaceae bacterium]|nr:MAG: cation/multidrug efflux pump [Alteromonadaceae bacterium]